MKKIQGITKILIGLALVLLLASCTTFTSSLDTSRDIPDAKDMKKGKACAKYILGSIDVSFIGNIGYRFSGEESATLAAKNAGITKPFGIDRRNKNYLVYTKKCVVVWGK